MLVDAIDGTSSMVLCDLPTVDIYKDKGILAILDEGCKSTVHGDVWARNAEAKLESLGFTSKFQASPPRGLKGLSGNTYVLRVRSFSFSILTFEKNSLPSVFGAAPVLVSSHAQATLQMTKVVREGRAFVSLPSNPEHRLDLKLYRTHDSGLLAPLPDSRATTTTMTWWTHTTAVSQSSCLTLQIGRRVRPPETIPGYVPQNLRVDSVGDTTGGSAGDRLGECTGDSVGACVLVSLFLTNETALSLHVYIYISIYMNRYIYIYIYILTDSNHQT